MTIATIIPSLTNAPPSRANPAAFPTDGDTFLNQFDDIVSAQNDVASELTVWNSEIETFKNQASNSQTNAASSSSTALTQARNAAASMVSLWVSGTTYSAGQTVYSNVDGREYKRKSTGAGATDPSSDTTNWEPLGWEYITNYPDIRPTLDLNFAGSQTVDPRITFTRNSIAAYFDKFGVMQTADVNQPRIDFDPATGECKGLLIEEARTNVLLNSAIPSTQNVTTTAVTYTLSFYGTGTITRSGTSSGVLSGAGLSSRVSVTFTPTAGTLTLTVSGTVLYAQLEVGAFPTSYIPTTFSAVTRQADVASMTGVNFSSWYRQDEGTIFIDAIAGLNGSYGLSLFDGTSSNYIVAGRYASTGTAAVVAASGSIQANIGSGALNARVSLAYRVNDFAVSTNGADVATDTAGNVPVVDRMRIGAALDGSIQINGTIKRITYYPKRLPNQVLQSITQP